MTDPDAYAWIEANRDVCEALSITLARPVRPDPISILRPSEALGDLTIQQTLDRSLEIGGYGWRSVVAAVDELDGWTVLIEPNGFVGPLPGTLKALSAGGRAASAFWNVNAVMSFSWAIDGQVIRQFDPLLYDADGRLPEEEGLPFGHPGEPRIAAMTLLDRLTGVHIERTWLLDRVRPTFIIPATGWDE
jgi:hypothetical protein